jgi:hypothetical protein
VKLEIYELYTLGLVQPAGGGYWLGARDVATFAMEATGEGIRLCDLMSLSDISAGERSEMAGLLWWSS